jgi:Beta-galactosidase, domain 2/Beta-galactosidase, domain 3
LTLDGRDSKIITAYYDFGSQHLVYSTSEIFTHIVQDSRDVILVYAYEGHAGEIALKYPSESVNLTCSSSDVTSYYNDNILQVNYHHPDGTNPVCISSPKKDLLILVAGYESATKWWAPEIALDERVLISGPYLVRSASVENSTLSFYGDTDQDTIIEIVASESLKTITWNDQTLELRSTSYGTWTSFIPGPSTNITLPDLSKASWKYSNASPETQLSFDDSKWINANHTSTNSPYKPTTYPVLYGDEYGKLHE